MRFTTATATLLVAGPALTAARWLQWSGEEQATSIPKETGALPVAGRGAVEQGLLGWTPKPTPAPGARRSEQDLVVEYLRRRQDRPSSGSSRNTWTNEQTCGWFQGTSSSAYTCDDKFSCVTNDDHNIACGSGTYSPFFTVCLDYNAFKDGACDNANSLTGCCQASTEPACGTYIWTGSPTRSMYRCFASSTIISMLDIPQFVIDASKSSASEASKSSEAARLSSLTASKTSPGSVSATTTGDGQTGQPTSSDGETGGAVGASDGSDGGTGEGTNGGNTTNDSTNNGTGKSNTPAIVGGVVGGLTGLILLILALLLARRNKWKCTMNRNSNKNTTKRSDRSERKKNYKNTLVKEIHHGEKDSYESSQRNSHTYTQGPPPVRDPGAAPAQTGSGGLAFPWTNSRGPTTHTSDTSHYPAPVDSGAATPALHDQRQIASTNASQQQHPQQQGATEYPNPSLNPSLFPNAQRDGPGSNGNNVLIPSQGVPTAAGYQQPQTLSSPPQAQHLAPLTNTGYSSSSIQATGPNHNDGSIHPGASGAAYQQPQYTGNSSAPPTAPAAPRTNAAGSSQSQNFATAAHSYATSMSPQGTGPSHSGNSSSSSPAVPGYQQQPQFSNNNSASQTPGSGPSGTATGLGAGAGAGALALSGVHLDINNNNHALQQLQQQQNNHYYHHQQPENATATATATGGIPGSQPPQQQQQQPRYMDSSTMTTDAAAAPAEDGGRGAAAHEHEQSRAASYQQPQYTGVSAMTSTTTRDSVDAGFYQPSHITGLDRHRSISLSPTTTTATTATSPVVEAENAGNGSSKGTGTGTGRGAGAGAWYQRPAGVQAGDEPIELEARPAVRKVD